MPTPPEQLAPPSDPASASIARGTRGGLRLRHLGWVLVALVTVGLIFVNRHEWAEVQAAARAARPGFLVLALVLQACWLVIFASTFWTGLGAVAVSLPYRRTLALAWACNFVNMVVKSGGMAGLALFITAAGRRGYAGSRTALGYLLVLTLGYLAFFVVLGAALVLLWLQGDAGRFELLAAGGTALTLTAIMGTGMWVITSEQRLHRAYRLIARVVNAVGRWFGRRPRLNADAGSRAAREMRDALRLVRERPARLLPATLAAGAKEVTGVLVLYAVLKSFHPDASLSLAVIAYALTILFSYISIVPSGFGLVEVSVTALLIRSDVPPGAAALGTVVYRLCQFWIPLVTGAVAARFTRAREMPASRPAP